MGWSPTRGACETHQVLRQVVFLQVLSSPIKKKKKLFQHYFQSGPNVNRQTGAGASQLTIQWTIQHGCGGNEDTDPQKQNCNLVLQYMCEDTIGNVPGTGKKVV